MLQLSLWYCMYVKFLNDVKVVHFDMIKFLIIYLMPLWLFMDYNQCICGTLIHGKLELSFSKNKLFHGELAIGTTILIWPHLKICKGSL